MKTGLITSDTYQNHNTGDGHPEKIDRVTVVIDNFKKLDNKDLVWKKPSKFDRSLLEITHNSDYINFVEKSFPEKGLSFLDGDTIVSPGSKDATSDAVGSIITAVMIEPTASDVASLLPGETIVSPSKKDNPFSGKDFSTKFI